LGWIFDFNESDKKIYGYQIVGGFKVSGYESRYKSLTEALCFYFLFSCDRQRNSPNK